jgi:CheY-like chemotaxis protein
MSDSDRHADILVIDDDTRCRESLVSILELEGYQVACAAHGLEALFYLRREPLPSLLLLDLRMPVMDGWRFREQQQEDPVLADIPVVVMTGAADRDQEALAVDAAGYFLKPYNVTALLDLVATYCQDRPGSERSPRLTFTAEDCDRAGGARENQPLEAGAG